MMQSLNEEHLDKFTTQSTNNALPDWLDDIVLKNGRTETISRGEEQFWYDLIDRYLKPLEYSAEQKESVKSGLKNLRDICVFAFVMANTLFVLIILVLQLSNNTMYIDWPFAVQTVSNLTQANPNEPVNVNVYLELEPIGVMFMIFFGILLIIQFLSMLVHRFGTIAQLLSETNLEWYYPDRFFRKPKPAVDLEQQEHQLVTNELREKSFAIVRELQRPKPQWDENNTDLRNSGIERTDTIKRILYQYQGRDDDYNDLETNFCRSFFSLDKYKLHNLKITQHTIEELDRRRNAKSSKMKSKRMRNKFNPVPQTDASLYYNNSYMNLAYADDKINADDKFNFNYNNLNNLNNFN